jgi:hypothetical protein
MQVIVRAFIFALLKTGNNMAARMAMMAMTTSNSINVNPDFLLFMGTWYIDNIDFDLKLTARQPTFPAASRAGVIIHGDLFKLSAASTGKTAHCRSPANWSR